MRPVMRGGEARRGEATGTDRRTDEEIDMKLLIIGAGGKLGREFIRQGVEAGHDVSAMGARCGTHEFLPGRD